MHWELHSTTNAMLVAPPVATHSERIYQVFGKETLEELIPLARADAAGARGLAGAATLAPRAGIRGATASRADLRLHGFTSKPEIQKLNRNSIFIFVNGRLIRDKVVMHGILEGYRNIIPPTVYPVVLLFLEMPCTEVDVNVHPSKTEVRFRQQSFVHDFVRDSVRSALMAARPAAGLRDGDSRAALGAGGAYAPPGRPRGADRERAILCEPPDAGASFPFFSLIPAATARCEVWKATAIRVRVPDAARFPSARFGAQAFGSAHTAGGGPPTTATWMRSAAVTD